MEAGVLKPSIITTPGANTTTDSIKGKEFAFDSLEWIGNDRGNPIFYMVDSKDTWLFKSVIVN